MKERSFDEMIAFFNRRVSEMDISQDCKMELLGMVTALGYKHEKTAQRWIPVSEMLPEANGRYLVTRGLNACGAMWNRVYIINYSDLMGIKSERIWWQGNVGKSDFERIDDVVAWKPLEEPWRGEETCTKMTSN